MYRQVIYTVYIFTNDCEHWRRFGHDSLSGGSASRKSTYTGNTKTEKTKTYHLHSSDIRKIEAVFGLGACYCPRTHVSTCTCCQKKPFAVFVPRNFEVITKSRNRFYFVVVAFSWGRICQYFRPVSYLGYTETLNIEQDSVYTLTMQLPFLTSSVTD